MCVVIQDDLEGETALDFGDYQIVATEFNSGKTTVSVRSLHDGRTFEIARVEAEPHAIGIELYGDEGRSTVGKFSAPYTRNEEE